jgi:hypothetical protein
MNGPARLLTAALMAAGLVTFAVGCGNGKVEGNAGGDTPEETFKTATAAFEKEDWKTFCDCMTPESKDTMAVGMATVGMMIQGFAALGGDEADKETAKIKETLAKHGLTEDFFKELEKKEQPNDEAAAMKMMLEPVKDRGQFVADMMGAMQAMGDKGPQAGPSMPKDAELKDVKIDGDSAKGSIEFERDGKQQSEPIAFKKIDGKWLMDMTQMMKQGGGGPPVGGGLPPDFPVGLPGDAPAIPPADAPGDTPTEDPGTTE